MKVFNTLTKKKEDFVTINPGEVKMYVCGPTVYDFFHIGNARTFVMADVVRRYLEYKDYKVTFIKNFTDIDDKMIKRANEEGITVKELADRFIAEYYIDAESLGLKKATQYPKATEFINEIIEIVQGLIDKGLAYVVDNDVYYDTVKFKEYGKLSWQNMDELNAGARVLVEEKKKNPADFVLWKGKKEGEPFWKSPWGDGRPGWHIECSAMSMKLLGKTIDIHAGGTDLVFPHHENEIAQSEGFTGQQFVNYWLHGAFLNINNEKMSKSLGNFFTVRDISKEYPGKILRFFLMSAHYRSPLNFDKDMLEQSLRGYKRLENFIENLNYAMGKAKGDSAPDIHPQSYKERFIKAMDDDFNTADGISVIFEMVRDINPLLNENTSKEFLTSIKNVFLDIMDSLGFTFGQKGDILTEDIETLIQERQKARKDKDFKRADEIRVILQEKGIILEDTPGGVRWKRI